MTDAIAKIKKFKAKLATAKQDGIDHKQRQKWRNIVSAQQSRMKKKQEVRYLQTLIQEKDRAGKQIINMFYEGLASTGNTNLAAKILQSATEQVESVDYTTFKIFEQNFAICDEAMVPSDDEDGAKY